MKKPNVNPKSNQIVHTQFLEDVLEGIGDILYCLDIKGLTFNAEKLFAQIGLVYELVKKCMCDTISEQPLCIEWMVHLMVDLSIIQDLEVPYYANPKCIDNAVLILSEKLAEQLVAKAHNEANYNEYYCQRLAEVLGELCELIKEV